MSDRDRLDRAFAALEARGVAAVLILRGSTGVRDWDLRDYLKAAKEAATADWVGAHVGSDEHGGAYWGADGCLYFAGSNAPVTTLWFSFNHHNPELAAILTGALRAEGLTVEPREHGSDRVIVRLGGV